MAFFKCIAPFSAEGAVKSIADLLPYNFFRIVISVFSSGCNPLNS